MDDFKVERDRMCVVLQNDTCLGWIFPRELRHLVVDYSVKTIVYHVVLEKEPTNPCGFISTRFFIHPNKTSWWVMNSRQPLRFETEDDSGDDDDDDDDEVVTDRKHLILAGFLDDELDDEYNYTVRFMCNGKTVDKIILSIKNDSLQFPDLEIELGDSGDRDGSIRISPFSSLQHIRIKHHCTDPPWLK
jgi:hypothetical protein